MRFRFLPTLLLLTLLIFTTTQCSKTIEIAEPPTTLNTFNNKPVGASANEILSDKVPNLVLEINYMTGYKLQATSLNTLNAFLGAHTKKGSFQLIEKEIPVSGKDSLSLTELDQIERKNRTTFNSPNQVSIYILVTDGQYNPPTTLGIAYRNTSMVLFGRTIHRSSGGTNQVPRWKLETSTLEHEFGHLFGLVDVGSPMQTNHKDAAHPAHCTNNRCLMYYLTETSQLAGSLMSRDIYSFDANCRNDLIANGGK